MGPHLPYGLMATGRRMHIPIRRRSIISSPVSELKLYGSLFPFLMSFGLSFEIKCFAAGAGFFGARDLFEGGTCPLGDVMVKSKPTQVYGMGGTVVRLREGTGRNQESKGRKFGSSLMMCFGSTSTREPLPIMPAVSSIVRKVGAVSSLIRSCIIFFETRRQQKVCMPKTSMTAPQRHDGQLVTSYSSRHNFILRLMRKRSFGWQWDGMLRHMPMMG